MTSLFVSILLSVAGSYFSTFPNEARRAVEIFGNHRGEFGKLLPGASDEEVAIAFAIVAPEMSQYSALSDYFETLAVKEGYPSSGKPDYSIGLFQMKPSFAESLENEVAKSAVLKKKYSKRMAYSTADVKKQRCERVNRLSETSWQLFYLAVFIEVVKQRTAKWGLKGNEEKVRYWATLYNAGFYLSRERVEQRQGVKQFPRGTKEFNYSAVAVEFYEKLSAKKLFEFILPNFL